MVVVTDGVKNAERCELASYCHSRANENMALADERNKDRIVAAKSVEEISRRPRSLDCRRLRNARLLTPHPGIVWSFNSRVQNLRLFLEFLP